MDRPDDTPDEVIAATRHWLVRAVIGLNLCPFAKAVHVREQVRYVVSAARSAPELLEQLADELRLLVEVDPEQTETTLLIHPHVLGDFIDYLWFIDLADQVLQDLGLTGEFQIAHFHPAFQFEGSTAEDAANCTNRSPYPILHLLRESSIDRAVAAFPDASAIYQRNIDLLREMGPEGWRALWREAP